jgi:epothilone polyketide synthase D
MACRFPGAQGIAEFWNLLREGGDATSDVPVSRFDIEQFYDPRPGSAGHITTRRGGFIEDADKFDAAFFGISPREAEKMDPQQRLLLETAWDALEDAGMTRPALSAQRVGVFVGAITRDYRDILYRSGVLDVHSNIGTTGSGLAGRLSYAFDLRGPSISLDTACSSALAAVHLACQSLRSGESTVALAGGSNLVLSPEEGITFSQANMLSPEGRCKFASRHADGFVRSDGVGVVVLKLLQAAVADGDAIHAVIRGIAVANDGRSSGALLTPGEDGQVATLRAAHADAGIDPGQVDYVEAHGTGTVVGDAVELRALASVFDGQDERHHPLAVGSVKTNIGHTEGAAGIAGLIKVILSLEHRVIPPSLHSQQLSAALDWSRTSLRVQREITQWPGAAPEGIAGISSFGLTGTNAHAVLSGYAAHNDAPAAGENACLLPLSARNTDALRGLADKYVTYLAEGGEGRGHPLSDICYSAAVRREHHECRLGVTGTTHDELAGELRSYLEGKAGPRLHSPAEGTRGTLPVVFVFPGAGAQWAGMGCELLQVPAFRAAITDCDSAIRAEAGWSVIDRLTAADESALTGANVIQPTLWAMEVALAALWQSWGVQPDHVVGHSMGEVAAATVCGALSLPDGAAVICRRSSLTASIAGRGAMVLTELSAQDAEREISGYPGLVSIAAINGPASTVLSGDPEAIEKIGASLAGRDVFCRAIPIDFASHCPQVDPVCEPLREALRKLCPVDGTIPLYSTVLGEPVPGHELTADYWVRNLREPVRFDPVLQRLLAGGPAVVIEVSPHPVLKVPMTERAGGLGHGATIVASTVRGEPERASMLDATAAVYAAGQQLDWKQVCHPAARYVRVPGYAWQRERYWCGEAQAADGPWLDRRAGRAPRETGHENTAASGHPLLGDPAGDGVWEAGIDLGINAYLADHRVQDTIVLTGTASVELALAAARTATAATVAVKNLRYRHPVFPDERGSAGLRVSISPRGERAWDFEVRGRSADDATWRTHVAGRVEVATGAAPAGEALDEILRRCPGRLTGRQFYAESVARGNQWLGTFQGITELWRGPGEALARIEVPAKLRDSMPRHHFHPAVLDACAQVIAATIQDTRQASEHQAFMLASIDEVRVYRRPGSRLWSHCVQTSTGGGKVSSDITVRGDDGSVIAELRGLALRYLEAGEASQPASGKDPGWLYTVRWRPAPSPSARARDGGRWLVFADRGGVAEGIAAGLDGPVVLVTEGAGYRLTGPGRYELDPSTAQGYLRLLTDLRSEFTGPVRVAHLWSLDCGAAGEGGTAGLQETAERMGVRSVLHLVQALEAARWPTETRLWLVTQGAQSVSADACDPADARQAVVWGFGRALSREQERLACTLIDLPARAGRPDLDLLREELLTDDDENQIALRGGVRHVARLARHEMPAALPSAPGGDRTPDAFLAPYYALTRLTRVKPGERVLVRGGENPAGMAAIQIARWTGAQVVTTAGTPLGRAFLRTMGARQVMGPGELSADTRFEVIVDADEKDAGVALPLLAPHGRYVDVASSAPGSGAGGPRSRCYFAVSADDLIMNRPGDAEDALREIRGLISAGMFTPLPEELNHPGTGPAAAAVIRPDATYLITGGLGGVGIEVARWLAASGARHLLLAGRTPLAADERSAKADAVRELEERGVRVVYRAVDIADETAMRALLAEHSRRGDPAIRGVIHAAGLVAYQAVADLDPAELTALLRPKLAGGWILHTLLRDVPLDFFVLFSSASAILASPRLAAYGAANAALDAIARTRRAEGMPAMSINWAYWSSVGMGARYAAEHGREITPRGMASYRPDEAIAVLNRLLAAPPAQVTVLAADWPTWSAAYPEAARDPLLRELIQVPEADPAPARANDPPGDTAPRDGDGAAVRAFVTEVVARVLKLPVPRLNMRKPLIDEGMDSLMATELRREVQREFSVNVSITKMLHGMTLADLVDVIADDLSTHNGANPAVTSGGAQA